MGYCHVHWQPRKSNGHATAAVPLSRCFYDADPPSAANSESKIYHWRAKMFAGPLPVDADFGDGVMPAAAHF